MLGTEDVILILLVALFLFGEEKLPELARSLGKAVGEFKKAQTGSEIGLKGKDTKSEDVKNKDTKSEDVKNKDTKSEDVKNKDTKNENSKIENSKNEDIDKNTKIINLALEMGIDIEGKSLEQLIEEIRIKVRDQKWKVKN